MNAQKNLLPYFPLTSLTPMFEPSGFRLSQAFELRPILSESSKTTAFASRPNNTVDNNDTCSVDFLQSLKQVLMLAHGDDSSLETET
jgi:hypothetical protein